MKKLISIILALSLTILWGGVLANAETTDELTLTVATLNSESTATHVGDTITIAKGQKAIFKVSVDKKITYDVTLPDVDTATLATYQYQVLISYDSKDVIKLYNNNVKSQPGWITFQANTTALTIENLGTTDMILTSVKLTKKVFGADEDKIVLPAMNYDFSASSVDTTTQNGAYITNGETQSFIKDTNYGRMNLASSVRLGFDINLKSAGDYYLLASVKQPNRQATYIVELDGTQILSKSITANEDNRSGNYSYLYNVGKIHLNAGENKLVPRIQEYTQVNGYILVKPSSIAQVGASNNMLYASTVTAWIWWGGYMNNPRFMFNGTGSFSYTGSSEVGWMFNVQNADTYNLDIVGNYNGTSTMKVVIDGVAQDVSITGIGVSGQTLANISTTLDAGTHIITTRANTGLTFNGIKLDYTSKIANYTRTVKAGEFNFYKGQGDMAATYGGYYDTTPAKMDGEYLTEYSPCEFRHPGGNTAIDAAIMSIYEWMEYTVFVPADGYYDLSASVATEAGKDASFNIITNGSNNIASYSNGKEWNTFYDIEFHKVYLKDGANQIIVKNTYKGVDFFASFTLKYAYSNPVELTDGDGNVLTQLTKGTTYTFTNHEITEGVCGVIASYDTNGVFVGVEKVINSSSTDNTFTISSDSTAIKADVVILNSSSLTPVYSLQSFDIK